MAPVGFGRGAGLPVSPGVRTPDGARRVGARDSRDEERAGGDCSRVRDEATSLRVGAGMILRTPDFLHPQWLSFLVGWPLWAASLTWILHFLTRPRRSPGAAPLDPNRFSCTGDYSLGARRGDSPRPTPELGAHFPTPWVSWKSILGGPPEGAPDGRPPSPGQGLHGNQQAPEASAVAGEDAGAELR